MFYPRDVVDEVRMGNDIIDVIGSYVKLNKRGNSYVGLCPFHKEKTPSFNVNQDTQLYYCFGCGAGGNVISFVMEHEGFTFPDAIKFLADRINYRLPEVQYSEEQNKKRQLKQKLYDIHKIAARYYYECLNSTEGSNANNYLDKRQVSLSMRRKFGLGYSPIAKAALYKKLKENGFDDDIIFKSGLCYKKDNNVVLDKFFNRLMFPIIDVYGNIIGFGGRILGDGQPKYLNSPESEIFIKSENLFNMNFARKSKQKEFILVEGYMDVISIYQAGFKNVVASLGTAFNERHARTLKIYADSVILLFDSDEAGTKAILRAIPVLRSAGLKVRVVQVADAKDPDEYIKKFGPSAFAELIRKAENYLIFQAKQIRKKYDLDLLEGRIGFSNEVAKLMADSDNMIETDAYLKEISKITNIDISAIKTEMSNLNKNKDQNNTFVNRDKIKKVGTNEAKRSIISLLITNKSLYGFLKDILKPEYLMDELYTKVLEIIYDLYENDKPVIAGNVVSYFEKLEDQQKVSEIFINSAVFEGNSLEKAVNDQLKDILKSYYKNLLNKEQDYNKINNLMIKLKEINKLNISLTKG